MKHINQPEKVKKISSFTLKIIAVISMIIDHVGSIIFGFDGIIKPYVVDRTFMPTDSMPWIIRYSIQIGNICDILGAIAFPIFCFLIVQGFIHTRSKIKYMIRLGIFALISEIPYDIAHSGVIFSYDLQNVMFTLFTGALTLYFLEKVIERFKDKKSKQVLLSILVIILGSALAFAIRGEYVFLGIIAISLLYIFRDNWLLQLVGILPLIVASPWVVLSIIPLLLYNGKKGKGLKYLFYVFYPTHFILLVLITKYLTRVLIN